MGLPLSSLRHLLFQAIPALLLLVPATSHGGEPLGSADYRLTLGGSSHLTFVGASNNPVKIQFGTYDMAGDCVPIAESDGHGITFRIFRDGRNDPNAVEDTSPLRVCEEPGGANPNGLECVGAETSVTRSAVSSDFYQEDGVLRVVVRDVDLPATCIPGGSVGDAFVFSNIAGNLLGEDPNNPGHFVPVMLDPNGEVMATGAPLPESGGLSSQGAFEDQGYGRFGEAVFVNEDNMTGPNGNGGANSVDAIQLLFDDPDVAGPLTEEARQNGMRLRLSLGGRQNLGGVSFPAEIPLTFQITTGPVGGRNFGKVAPVVTKALGATFTFPQDGETVIETMAGSLFPRTGGTSAGWSVKGVTGTPPNATDPNDPFGEFIVWADAIAIVELAGSVSPVPGGPLQASIETLLPNRDGAVEPGHVPNAVDTDDDDDGLVDDDNDLSQFVDPVCENALNTNAGECLGLNRERTTNAVALGCAGGVSTDPLDPDSDDDGLCDGNDGTFQDPVCDGPEDLSLDGCFDVSETNPDDSDTDDDGLCDGDRAATGCLFGEDTSRDGLVGATETDPRNQDTDGDLLCDGNDQGDQGACEFGEDLDRNGMQNGVETIAFDDDTDDDGLLDGNELLTTVAPMPPTDPLDRDTDDDNVQDGTEFGLSAAQGDDTGPGVVFDSDPTTTTVPTDDDTDDDGLVDGYLAGNAPGEDVNGNGQQDLGETDPNDLDTDNDGLQDGTELGLATAQGMDTGPLFIPDAQTATTTNPIDDDTDDDGLVDGFLPGGFVGEDNTAPFGMQGGAETNPNDPDTDDDGLQDGTERGLTAPQGANTDAGTFVADADGATTTNPLLVDSDSDGLCDGNLTPAGCLFGEDFSRNGALGPNETDPTTADTDGDGLCDGNDQGDQVICIFGEDLNRNGLDAVNETDPRTPDTDGDGLCDGDDRGDLASPFGGNAICRLAEDANRNGVVDMDETPPLNDDADDDGLLDGGMFDPNGTVVPGVGELLLLAGSLPLDADTDDDGIYDGIERGLIAPEGDNTDLGAGVFAPDEDPNTVTDPADGDTDGDGFCDGTAQDPNAPSALLFNCQYGEDLNVDGERLVDETDPATADTDSDGLCDADRADATVPCVVGEDIDLDGLVDATETDPRLADTDVDTILDGADNCPLVMNAGQENTDTDLLGDVCDNCPTVANAGQEDGDTDLVGDACDNCGMTQNPRVAADFLTTRPWATTTGGQRDDDGDGYGNVCDGKFIDGSVLVGGLDTNLLLSSLGEAIAGDTCGMGADACARYDVNEDLAPLIGGLDTNYYLNNLLGNLISTPGFTCPTCPLFCEGDNCPPVMLLGSGPESDSESLEAAGEGGQTDGGSANALASGAGANGSGSGAASGAAGPGATGEDVGSTTASGTAPSAIPTIDRWGALLMILGILTILQRTRRLGRS